MRKLRIFLVLVVVASFGIALSYPIRYRLAQRSSEATMERLQAMRQAAMTDSAALEGEDEQDAPDETAQPDKTAAPVDTETSVDTAKTEDIQTSTPVAENTAAPAAQTATPSAGRQDGEEGSGESVRPNDDQSVSPDGTKAPDAVTPAPLAGENTGEDETPVPVIAQSSGPEGTPVPEAEASFEPNETPAPTPVPTPTLEPTPTIDRFERGDAVPYNQKEHIELDKSKILPEFREMYELNHDLVGWITIPGMEIDYPVVQSEDMQFYLKHDFFGKNNNNGQIILDTKCDPYTPSYNLVISGHNMFTGLMFGNLKYLASQNYWKNHKLVEFSTLMERKQYVIFAVFYSADFDVDETAFRYNRDIQYAMDATRWLQEIKDNQLYDTGIDAKFGDEFLTLTTCSRRLRENGRFVVVCRRIREGEEIE